MSVSHHLFLRALMTMRLRRTLMREQVMSVVTITTPSTIPSELYHTSSLSFAPRPRLREINARVRYILQFWPSKLNAKLISWVLKLPRKCPILGEEEKIWEPDLLFSVGLSIRGMLLTVYILSLCDLVRMSLPCHARYWYVSMCPWWSVDDHY